MRKSLLRLMLGGLAIVSAVSMANAQTLTLDWRSEKDIPDQTNVRWGAGFDGKVYCNDKSVPTIYVWDETGERSEYHLYRISAGLSAERDPGHLFGDRGQRL